MYLMGFFLKIMLLHNALRLIIAVQLKISILVDPELHSRKKEKYYQTANFSFVECCVRTSNTWMVVLLKNFFPVSGKQKPNSKRQAVTLSFPSDKNVNRLSIDHSLKTVASFLTTLAS